MLPHAARSPVAALRCRRDASCCAASIQLKRQSSVSVEVSSNAFISEGQESQPSQQDDTRRRRSYGKRFYAVKDNIATRDLPTTCASGMLQDYTSPFQATVLERARRFNSRIIGKTNMDEFGMGSHSVNSFFGEVRYVHNKVAYSAGGSSGGSAMSLLPKHKMRCSFAFGTDTGGSVRLPAAYTGVAGFKPSYGYLSRHGVVPYANSLDTVGIMAHSVDKITGEFLSINGYDEKDPTSAFQKTRQRAMSENINNSEAEKNHDALKALKEVGHWSKLRKTASIGVPIEYNIEELSPEVRSAWQRSLEILQEQGCKVVPVSLPNTKHALSSYYIIAPAEAASNLAKYDGVRYGTRGQHSDGAGEVLYSKTREGFGAEVKRRILLGSYTLSSEAIDNYFIKAQKVRRLVQQDFDRVFAKPNPLQDPNHFDLADMDERVLLQDKLGPSQVDFIICPTAPTTTPKLHQVLEQTSIDSYMNDVFTVPASLAGLPAISIPFRVPTPGNPDPAPIGIQIIGQHSDDIKVLGMATELMELLGAEPELAYAQFADRVLSRLPERKHNLSSIRIDSGGIERAANIWALKQGIPVQPRIQNKMARDSPSLIASSPGREAAMDLHKAAQSLQYEDREDRGDRPLVRTFPSYKGEDPPLPISKYQSDKGRCPSEPFSLRKFTSDKGSDPLPEIGIVAPSKTRTEMKQEVDEKFEDALDFWNDKTR